MKLDKLTLENFKGSASKLEVRFNEAVTYLIGINGAGKSMIGNAIQFLFTGKTFFNPKYRRKMISSDSKRMKVSGEFVNKETGKTMLISQSLTTGDTPNLKIETSDGSILEMTDVLEMIDPIYLRPFSIINESPKRQAEMVGVDTTKCDDAVTEAKKRLVPLRAEVDRCKKIFGQYETEPDKIEKVNILDLVAEKENIIIFNKKQRDKETAINNQREAIEGIENEIIKLQTKLEEHNKTLGTLPNPETEKFSNDIQTKIDSAEDTNNRAQAYEYYMSDKQDLEKAKEVFKVEEKNVIKATEAKIEYIKSCKVSDKISFDGEGGLMINAFDQENAYLNEDFFSKGQILKLAIQLCLIDIKKHQAENKDTIPFIFIDNAEALDKANHEYIQQVSEKHKLQFVLAYQDDQPRPGKSCIMLNEKIIKKYKDK